METITRNKLSIGDIIKDNGTCFIISGRKTVDDNPGGSGYGDVYDVHVAKEVDCVTHKLKENGKVEEILIGFAELGSGSLELVKKN